MEDTAKLARQGNGAESRLRSKATEPKTSAASAGNCTVVNVLASFPLTVLPNQCRLHPAVFS